MWGGRPRPPTLFADVLTAGDPTLVKRHDECSTSICHSESALAVRNLLLFRNVELKMVTRKTR